MKRKWIIVIVVVVILIIIATTIFIVRNRKDEYGNRVITLSQKLNRKIEIVQK
jgi:hypothetical protein